MNGDFVRGLRWRTILVIGFARLKLKGVPDPAGCARWILHSVAGEKPIFFPAGGDRPLGEVPARPAELWLGPPAELQVGNRIRHPM